MTALVLDASAALAWLLPSQTTTAANRLLAQADDYDFIAPDIFLWEVANVLMAKARGHSLVVEEAFGQLDDFEIAFDQPLTGDEVRELVEVAIAAGLSLFDAAYLSFAIEREAGLASRDGALLDAAIAAGVDVFDLRD